MSVIAGASPTLHIIWAKIVFMMRPVNGSFTRRELADIKYWLRDGNLLNYLACHAFVAVTVTDQSQLERLVRITNERVPGIKFSVGHPLAKQSHWLEVRFEGRSSANVGLGRLPGLSSSAVVKALPSFGSVMVDAFDERDWVCLAYVGREPGVEHLRDAVARVVATAMRLSSGQGLMITPVIVEAVS